MYNCTTGVLPIGLRTILAVWCVCSTVFVGSGWSSTGARQEKMLPGCRDSGGELHVSASEKEQLFDTYLSDCANRASKSRNNIRYGICLHNRERGVQVSYDIANRHETAARFSFSLSCKYDMVITDTADDTIYHYLDTRSCSLLPSEIVLEPGACRVKTFPLLSRLKAGGPYLVSAFLKGYESSMVTYRYDVGGKEKERNTESASIGGTGATTGGNKTEILNYSSQSKAVTIRIPRAQKVTISAYIINGQKVKQLSVAKYFSAGLHHYSLADIQQFDTGLLVIEVEGETFSERKVINIM